MLEQVPTATRAEAEQHVTDWCDCHSVHFNPADPITVSAVDSVEAVIRSSGSVTRHEAFAIIQRVMLTHIDEAISLTPGRLSSGW